jgi:hypothetical protein
MAKHKIKGPCELKKELSIERAQATRKANRERFAAVLEKDRFETLEDAYDLVCGLPMDAVRQAAFY